MIHENKLKTVRKKKGLSQIQLSENSGVSIRMIQHYEQGFRDINKAQASTIYKLARALGCSMEDIIEIENIVLVNEPITDVSNEEKNNIEDNQ